MESRLEEAIELLEAGIEVTLECDGYEYEVGPSENFVGGEGMEGYISVVLGNVVYGDAKDILEKSIDFLSKGNKKVTINF